MNAIHRTPGLPSVRAVLGIVGGKAEAQEAVAEMQASFPVIVLSSSRITRLVRAPLPMALLIVDGTIQGKWTRKIPDFLIEPLKANKLERQP